MYVAVTGAKSLPAYLTLPYLTLLLRTGAGFKELLLLLADLIITVQYEYNIPTYNSSLKSAHVPAGHGVTYSTDLKTTRQVSKQDRTFRPIYLGYICRLYETCISVMYTA